MKPMPQQNTTELFTKLSTLSVSENMLTTKITHLLAHRWLLTEINYEEFTKLDLIEENTVINVHFFISDTCVSANSQIVNSNHLYHLLAFQIT